MAMSDAERQRKRRKKLKEAGLRPLLVRGDNGEFDETIRVGLAVKALADKGLLSAELKNQIIDVIPESFDCDDIVRSRYMQSKVRNFLSGEDL